jgi:hypothetical protein
MDKPCPKGRQYVSIRSYGIFLLFCVLAITCNSISAQAEDTDGRFAIGLNWPGVSVKYGLSSSFALEARYQNESNINVMGPRLYYVVKGLDKLNLLAGVELDYVTFTGDVSKGTGYAGEIFIGAEYFINRSLSFQLDLGPAYISLADQATPETIDGMDLVANIGINYYFGK